MSKKKAKRARKEARRGAKKVLGVCLRCGGPLRRKDARCKGCGRVSPLYAGKAAAPYLIKSGNNVVPITAGRWRCWSGHANKASAGYCTSCGEFRATTAEQHDAQAWKAMSPARAHPLYAEWASETRPEQRELLWKRIHSETIGRDPGSLVSFIAKSGGHSSAHDLFVNETDPGTADLYWRLSHPWLSNNPKGGQAS